MLKIETINYPDTAFSANTYIMSDANNHAIVVDPGQKGDGLLSYLQNKNMHVDAIFLTHGHYDHIRGIGPLQQYYHCPVYINALDQNLILNPSFNPPSQGPFADPETFLPISDNEKLHFLGVDFVVIHTPFHTPGSVIFYCPSQELAFTGDTLFRRSIGRTDLFGGQEKLIGSTLNKIRNLLMPETILYPGHDKKTTLAEELRYNRFFLYY